MDDQQQSMNDEQQTNPLQQSYNDKQKNTDQQNNTDQQTNLDEQKNPDQHSHEFVGYIHNISSLKKGSYFDFQLQGKYKTVRGVCFSPTQLKRFTSFTKSNSPVKNKKFRVDTKPNLEDFLMNHDVNIETVPELDCEKNRTTNKSKNTKLQNAVITDPSGTIKLLLWGSFVNTITEGDTLKFCNVSVYKEKYNNEITINTVRSDTIIEFDRPRSSGYENGFKHRWTFKQLPNCMC